MIDAKCDIVLFQNGRCCIVNPASVAKLKCVPEISWKKLYKTSQSLFIEVPFWRKLEKNRPQFITENPKRVRHFPDTLFRVIQFFHVCDVAVCLGRKQKMIRHTIT